MTRTELESKLLDLATEDAVAFVNEFNEPIDVDKTDWDGVAFFANLENLGVKRDEIAGYERELIDLYSTRLTAETERLCE